MSRIAPFSRLEIASNLGIQMSRYLRDTTLGYGGPCPPRGVHRYVFNIFTLDTILDLPSGASEPQVLEAMKSHILDEGKLMGKYGRQ